ncbi:hypothetical protein LWP59_13410 [Amycolatopsis acidiphila]|uniref:Uncharacterized protein n=1 Tax=Amycolatopsis acidiphila TaxID=715473 RepID=A0A558AJ71_9PSEU|nr:hypothetical protein [Amycolatopsis acidiphila]TVT24316.1 hypothetical protein FNH06_07045 [Amycolatopsis acidiphila]UIJ62551.1 hypothetical protein LWP59_13410 [Amycolatopsis acidiphila]GHG85371.1 hypothetical protein GCM10017788_57970 [Amycolatopsis acidiphila]
MSDTAAPQDPFGLAGVRDRQDYVRRLTELLERGRVEPVAAVLSAAEAYAAAELLGQYAQLDPTGGLNQLAATLASRLYSRLGA